MMRTIVLMLYSIDMAIIDVNQHWRSHAKRALCKWRFSSNWCEAKRKTTINITSTNHQRFGEQMKEKALIIRCFVAVELLKSRYWSSGWLNCPKCEKWVKKKPKFTCPQRQHQQSSKTVKLKTIKASRSV